MTSIRFADNLHIEAIEYASQGNAVLGIRDSGKSYTATYIAERLLDAKIPWVAFDPIGIWKGLKVGKNGSGYQVVVAGDGGDIPLYPKTAVNIVRAAMHENIPLVIDLYSMQLTKADWKRIVEESIRLLLYENKAHGMRHIFIEEAAEFVPQRVGPDQGRVYAEIEKLARMGGNASLGYTLINQRAEEVNKAVLELCDCLVLHRQKGRHSLTALGKWLDIGDVSSSKEIIKSLPILEQGECWVWRPGSKEPTRLHIPEKRTVHPDRRNPHRVVKGVAVDVTLFVKRLQGTLSQLKAAEDARQAKEVPHEDVQNAVPRKEVAKDPGPLEVEIQRLTAAVRELSGELSREKSLRVEAERRLAAVRDHLKPQYVALKGLFTDLAVPESVGVDADQYEIWRGRLKGGEWKLLEFFIEKRRLTKPQMQILLGLNKESVRLYLQKLVRAGLVAKDGEEWTLREVA